MWWLNFIVGLSFTFLYFKLVIIHYYNQKQKKINLNQGENWTTTVISPVPLVRLAGSSSSLANGELVACGLLAAVLSCNKQET